MAEQVDDAPAPERTGSYVSVTGDDGIEVESNTETVEEIKSGLNGSKRDPKDITASEAGKLGAAAKKAREDERAKAEKEGQKDAKKGEAKADDDEEKDEKAKAKSKSDEKAEKDDDDEDEKADPEQRRRARTAKARINELTREKHEALRALEQERQRLAQFQAQVQQQQAAPRQEQRQAPGTDRPRPREEDFAGRTYQEYAEALAEWSAEDASVRTKREIHAQATQRAQQSFIATRQAQMSQAFEKAATSYREQMDAAREADPDFDSALEEHRDFVKALVPSPVLMKQGQSPQGINRIADHILNSQQAPMLLRYLAGHQAEARRIASLQPYQIGRELGRLEGRIEASQGAALVSAPTSSKARPPVRTVAGASVAADPLDDPESLQDDEYLIRRMAQIKKGGR